MSVERAYHRILTRRQFFGRTSGGIGVVALASLLNADAFGVTDRSSRLPEIPHVPPRAKRVIFLQQSGAPSQIDLFDPKPKILEMQGEELPESIRRGQRLTTMTAGQKSKPLAPSPFQFSLYGQSRAEISELLPNTARVADDLCFVRSMYTEAINHDPAITLFQTGTQQPGRPSMGAWLDYGLGSANESLPGFVVLVSGGRAGDQPLSSRLWGAGFLPPRHQGVRFRSGKDPVLYLSNPPGISREVRRSMLDGLAQLNQFQFEESLDPEVSTRIEQFEMAYEMQNTVPRIADTSDEPDHTFELYGDSARVPGTFAANCLLARRLTEQGVRFVQLYHRGWDHHTDIVRRIRTKCAETDQASAALMQDLKQRGLLKDTIIVWAGEFGRTVYCQGTLNSDEYGRDHHPRCFTVWMAGGGFRSGLTYGKTDEFSYNVEESPVHIHDLQATLLHCLGIDHERLTYRHEGRDYRLTDIAGSVVHKILV